MKTNYLNDWRLFAHSSLATLVLAGGVAWAQSNPGGQQQPPAPPQPSQQKQTDQPKTPPAPSADKPEKSDKADKADKSKAPDANKDRPDNTNRQQDKAEDRKPDQKQSDRKPATDRSTDRASDRDTQRPADRNQDRSTDRASDRSTDRATDRSTDRSKDPSTDRSTDRATDRSQRDSSRNDSDRKGKAASAEDLGFGFSEEKSDKGLKISKLEAKSVASKADFQEGDIIVSINDHRIHNHRDFTHWLHAGGNSQITIIVLRDDREVTLYLEPDVIYQETVSVSGGAWLGVDLYDRFSRMAVVLKVHPNSPAQRAGLRADDVIVAVQGEEIRSPEHLGEVIRGMNPGEVVEIEVDRNRRTQTVDATLARRESVTQRTEVRR